MYVYLKLDANHTYRGIVQNELSKCLDISQPHERPLVSYVWTIELLAGKTQIVDPP